MVLKRLAQECRTVAGKTIPVSSVDEGHTHDALIDLCKSINAAVAHLEELVNRSIEFLGQARESFDTFDRVSSQNVIKSNDTIMSAKKG